MIYYRDGYKYQLARDYTERFEALAGILDTPVVHAFFQIDPDGTVTIRASYAWDGLTGAIDDVRSLRASLVHDVCCQAVAEGLAPIELRAAGDIVFREIMRENGVPWPVVWWRFRAVTRYRQLVVARRLVRVAARAPKPLEAP